MTSSFSCAWLRIGVKSKQNMENNWIQSIDLGQCPIYSNLQDASGFVSRSKLLIGEDRASLLLLDSFKTNLIPL